MSEDPFDVVLAPVLRDLFPYLGHVVVIGGWVPALHRRFGAEGEWAIEPLRTTEVDILVEDRADGRSLAEALEGSGFAPVGPSQPYAVWERDATIGERIEIFAEHRGPWKTLATVEALEDSLIVGALRLRGLSVLREKSVELTIPVSPDEGPEHVVRVRLPELAAFLIQKAATFRGRGDTARAAKDLHYIVDLMQSGEARVEAIEKQLRTYCGEEGDAAELSRQARNHLDLVIREQSVTELRRRLADGLAVRHHSTQAEGDARAIGFLSDFRDLIPEGCGKE